MGYRTIAKAVGVPWPTLRSWVKDIPTDRVKAHALAISSRSAKSCSGMKRRGSVRAFLIRTRGYRCEDCGLSEWRGKKLPLEVEHINGMSKDHRDENVKLNCPNCHSLTPTWRGRKRRVAQMAEARS